MGIPPAAVLFAAGRRVNTMFTFAERFSLAISRVSSSKSSMYFMESKSRHKWFTDSINFQIVLMDFSVAMKWTWLLLPFVLRLPCSWIVVADITGWVSRSCVHFKRNLQRFAIPVSGSHLSIVQVCSEPGTTRIQFPWPEVTDDRGVLKGGFLATMRRLVRIRQIVQHIHEDNAEVRPWRALLSNGVTCR